MSRGGDFWTRRKAAVAAERQAEREALAPPVEDRPDEELLAELELPEPETLDSPDAVQDFLRHDLPQRLRARALRRLWRLNPVLANLDGLVDYGEDFTDAATVVDGMETVYQVGKGMLTALVEPEPESEAEDGAELGAKADTAAEPQADPDAKGAPAEPRGDAPSPLIAAVVPEPVPAPDPAPVAAPQRRMRFQVEGAA